ncbi:ArsR/SmtB family transcription factor [Salana multivorans]
MAMNDRHHSRHDHAAVAAVFRALSDPARLTLLHCLADGEARVTDLTACVALAQSTTSAHLAVLREAGLVAARAEGPATYYRLTTRATLALLTRAEELLAEGLGVVVHDHDDDVPTHQPHRRRVEATS